MVLVLIGAGGHGRVVAEVAAACGHHDIEFVDDAFPTVRHTGAWPVTSAPFENDDRARFCSIGDNATRSLMFTRYELDASPILVHPSAVVSPTASVAAGTVIMAGAVVNAGAQIDRGVIVNTGATIDHDCRIGEFVHISPGSHLGGGVAIGERSWIGIGAVVRHGQTIGDDVVVGAGAAVVSDVDDGQMMLGVPAQASQPPG